MKFLILLIFIIPAYFFNVHGKVPGHENNSSHFPDTLHPGRLVLVTGIKSTFFFGGITYLQFIWYKDHEPVAFHFYNDNAGWKQMDKAAHAYIAYHQSEIGYNALRWAGVNEKTALMIGGPLGLVLQTPIEIFDGMYEGYGFSWGDMIANASGAALFTGQQLAFGEQLAKLKFSYSPSTYARQYPWYLGNNEMERFFMDYNGHTYWLSIPIHEVIGSETIPRWLALSFGYSANGMIAEFKNPSFLRGEPVPEITRYRQYLFSLDIDFSRVPTRVTALKTAFRYLNLLKFPAPAIEFNQVDKLKIRGLYY